MGALALSIVGIGLLLGVAMVVGGTSAAAIVALVVGPVTMIWLIRRAGRERQAPPP